MRPLILLLLTLPAIAQIWTMPKETLETYTARNPFGRFADGRPKVPDALLEKAKDLTAEEVWGVIQAEYPNQFEGNFLRLQPDKKLVGRAVTAQFLPYRPDLDEPAEKAAIAAGKGRNANQRVIDLLEEGDVLVVDLFGMIEGGTMVGNNLALAIYSTTKAGFVFDGALRDLEVIQPTGMQGYFRGAHPSGINRKKVMLSGVNVPVRIGQVTVMPGDVVVGDRTGVSFIPPHLVEKVVNSAFESRIHDEWRRIKFLSGTYKSSDLYPSPQDPKLKQDYDDYTRKRLAEMGLKTKGGDQ
jgi:regulator of RNase E activity RraA